MTPRRKGLTEIERKGQQDIGKNIRLGEGGAKESWFLGVICLSVIVCMNCVCVAGRESV